MNAKSKPLTQKQIKNDVTQMTVLVEGLLWESAIELAKSAPHVFRHRMTKACVDSANVGQTFLNHAVENGTLEAVSAFLAAGAPIEGRSAEGETALLVALSAVYTGVPRHKLVTFLLDAGARVDAVTDLGDTPLYCRLGLVHPNISRRLINLGAPVNAMSTHPLESAFARLVKFTLGTHDRQTRQNSPTFNEASEGLATVRLLLEHGVDLNFGEQVVTSPMRLPLGVALYHGNIEFAELFAARGANWRAVTCTGQSMMFAAAFSAHAVRWLNDKDSALLDRVDHRGRTPLMACLERIQGGPGAIAGAIALITAGADLDALSYEGVLSQSPRMMIESGTSEELKAFLRSFTCAQAAAGVLDEINADTKPKSRP